MHLSFTEAFPKIRAGASRQSSDDPSIAAWQSSAANLNAEFARMYPEWFCQSLQRVRSQTADETDFDTAVAFLEADPVAHRSGYIKADLCRWLARSELPQSVRDRLTGVVLRQLEVGWRQGFVQFCKLARQIDSEALRASLDHYCNSGNEGVATRARRMRDVVVSGVWKRDHMPDRRWDF